MKTKPQIILSVAKDRDNKFCVTTIKDNGECITLACSSLEEGLQLAKQKLGIDKGKEYLLYNYS